MIDSKIATMANVPISCTAILPAVVQPVMPVVLMYSVMEETVNEREIS